MTELPSAFLVHDDEPLIGVIVCENGHEVTRYFTDEQAADAATADSVQRALSVIGAWSDLDWEEAERTLDRIRHESRPTPPITDL